MTDQDRMADAFSAHDFLHFPSNSFIRTGLYHTFHRLGFYSACRLGVLDLNLYRHFNWRDCCFTFRRVVPVVRNHCKTYSSLWMKIHNAIQDIIDVLS
ncbi:hypothetical protein CEXT_623491 [Caerostris extrusa]|uniref:Uncharacterized protein n=1 Tax=Caerostris extrusa TaxID=172846 RepID=A0AAV4W919_CAEEX|nr:hypothetical protein CEXT_623491 [Caerostris extrusa]